MAIPQIIVTLAKSVPQIIQTIISVFRDNIPLLLDAAIELFSAIIDAFPTVIDELTNALPQIVETVYNELVKPVMQIFTVMWDWLKNGAGKAWDGIKSVFGKVADFFKDTFTKAWTAVKNVFSVGGKIFDGIKDGIITAFKSVVNVIIKGLNKVVKVPLEGLNSILDRIQSISFMNLTPFSWLSWRAPIPEIPLLARGGVVSRATAAVVGEQGKEAIVPLERNTGWIKQVAKEIAAQQKPAVTVNQTNNYAQAHSRNNRAGMLIGQGKKPEEALKEVGMVVEGVNALPAAIKLCERYGMEMPLIRAVQEVIRNGADPKEIVQNLMGRELKREN